MKEFSEKLSIRVLFCLLVPLIVGGCATRSSVDPKASGFQKVAVVSVVGNYLAQMKVGFTVFGNNASEIDVSEWQLDRNYEAIVADALRKRGLDATPIATDPQSLKPMFLPSTLRHVAFDMDSRWAAAEPLFKEIARTNNVEALVVVAPNTSGDYFSQTNQLLRGLGIYTRSSTAKLHLISRLVMISGQSGKPVGHTPISAVQPTFPGGPHQRGQPSVDIDSSLANTPFNTMTSEQKSQVRKAALAIPLASAINATIPQLLPAR